ncbi:MAG: hypothetical protein PHT57_13165 [Rhodoferax sp.]|nr:hypothetical protein [Rhodoferax sp.]
MAYIKKEKAEFIWPVMTALMAFVIGYIHHRWFYSIYFHGDAASMHVLAKAMIDESSLLPVDFSYGNQLIFLRSSPFIALALLAGFKGYKAFIVGSALSISFWGVVLYFFLSTYFKSRRKGWLFSILLLLPLGPWESDFILGQQSHLSNVILALGVAVFINLFILNKNKFFLFVACGCLFLISAEAPMRGLLVLVPILILLGFGADFGVFLVVFLTAGLTFSLSYLVNKLIIYKHPIAINYFNTLTFKSSDEFINNIINTTRELIGSISSINMVSGNKISLLGFFVFSFGFLLIIVYIGLVFSGIFNISEFMRRKIINIKNSENFLATDNLCFVYFVAVTGVVVGEFSVAALNPDSARHYLWAVFLLKLIILKLLYDVISKKISNKKSAVFVLVAGFLMSFWFAELVKQKWNTDKAVKYENLSEEIHKIRSISEISGINKIYGEDFWRMMPLNTLIDGINAQTLVIFGGEIYSAPWLSRPSWSCAKSDVLYYLKDGSVDKMVKERLVDVGGVKMHDGMRYSIWKGPKVWEVLRLDSQGNLPNKSPC